MTDDEIRDMQMEKNRLNSQVIDAYEMLCLSREAYKRKEGIYKNIKDKFDTIDRQLAMVDGRFKTVKPSVSGKMKKDLSINLNGDQVIRIAEVLGIELEIE